VALNATTGKLAWSYQTVHHDLWDMDMPSQPTLADIDVNGKTVPVIYAPAKTGNIFVLDRVTASWWSRHRKNRFRRARPKAITCKTQPFSDPELPSEERSDRRGHVGRHHVRPAGVPRDVPPAAL
jgi:quinoprotein glucose dehydrogenase